MPADLTTRLAAVRVGGGAAWERLGFAIDDGLIPLGNGAIDVRDGAALLIEGADGADGAIDGVMVERGVARPGAAHPNGALSIDHVVLVTDSLERTSAAVAAGLGLPQKRVREVGTIRQGFHRFARTADGSPGCIVEIVESDRTQGPTALFGLVVIVAELVELCADLGPDVIGLPKPAVQTGRMIATVRSGVGLGVPVALMTPDP